MRHVKFTMTMNSDFGMIGALPNIYKGWGNFLAGDRLGHDLVDHTTKETGEIWQEFRALGAHLFVHQFGIYDEGVSIWGKGSPMKNKAYIAVGDYISTLEDGLREGEVSIPEPKLAKLNKTDYQKLRLFFNYVLTEVKDQKDSYEGEVLDCFYENQDKIFGWLMFGFASAKRRYKGEHGGAHATKLAIDRELRRKWDILEQYEGEEFTLSFDIMQGYATISHRWLI